MSMNNKLRRTIFTACAWVLAATTAHGADAVIASPDGRTTLRIAEDGATFSVTRRGETVIAASPLGLDLDGAPGLSALALEKRDDVAVDRTIALVATKAASARVHYRGATLAFREAGGGRRLFIDVRAYDEGVAFRYRLEDTAPVRLRGERTAFVSAGGLTSAWRVVMMADRAGELIESHLIGDLNPSSEGDFSWVKPGKSAWDWWTAPPLAGMKPDMAAYKRFIDFAAEAGLPYYLIDAGWAWGSGPECWVALPGTDITRGAEGIDMQELVRYAAAKGVGLMLWAHWQLLAPRMDEVLDTYVRWGIKGVKVDFMDRDDQQIVDFYHRVAAATAKRKLLLNLHGAYVPAGLQRTYPNFITQEGVLGAEWNKMNREVTPRHNLMLPYTRMLAGPMDYTPGGFRNATPSTFEVRAEMAQTQHTRGQALAMYVVFESPLQMVSDDPAAYRGEPGFDFIRRVPTAWDETRFITGEPGRDIVLARRLGKTWYLGAMTSDEARTEHVPLRFLAPGKYRATVWQDGATPNKVVRSETTVKAGDLLNLQLAAGGGAAVILEHLK